MDLSELEAAVRTLKCDRPVAYVTSRQVWCDLKIQTMPDPDPDYTTPAPLMGAPIYYFPDVPKTELWCFYDQEVLNRYAELREKIGHTAAIQRLTAEVDDELIMKAELRALLNRS